MTNAVSAALSGTASADFPAAEQLRETTFIADRPGVTRSKNTAQCCPAEEIGEILPVGGLLAVAGAAVTVNAAAIHTAAKTKLTTPDRALIALDSPFSGFRRHFPRREQTYPKSTKNQSTYVIFFLAFGTLRKAKARGFRTQ
ncbi:hypothetical protein GCM10009765_79590 [Fodinicola feengrottensis]|uniref:Uncharacterized protein n=1 Tax=Fodinicola feengrottensis TaxID=435914 RepID=A0ABN2J6Y4_9ACTN